MALHLTRRHTLRLMGAAAAAGLAPVGARADALAPRVLGSSVDASGAFRVGLLDAALEETPGAVTPVRMHALSPRPDGFEAVAVGRRPADIAMVLDGSGRTLRSVFHATPGRRFSGHGAYSPDGATFLSAEIDAETGEGFVVVRDVKGGHAARAESASAGVGPHELAFVGGLVAVANGAKEPKSEPGIKALGLTRARSNVAIVDPTSGAIASVAELDDDAATLSLRHLTRTPDGGLLVAAQDAQPGAHDRPLIAKVEGTRLRWLDAGYAINARFGGYVGTIVTDASGRYIAASSPKGGIVAVFDAASEELVGLVTIPDCCGLAPEPEPGRFLASNGLGEIARIAAHDGGAAIVERRAGHLRWDNHLALLPA